ncbi:hypothetical protein BGZ51_005038 [Haplosporangium sp. Z 767]|nr:hypothetical protein BGZ51_005038 [Haplosporangium sp. Z 767]KAF9182140.1 hypothetical protein BGZ50_005107 [Haplosporangium sp. Z 11]
MALIPCTHQSKDHLLAALRLGATTAIFFETQPTYERTQNQNQDQQDRIRGQDDCPSILLSPHQVDHGPISTVLMLDRSTSRRLAFYLDKMEAGSDAMATLSIIEDGLSHVISPTSLKLTKAQQDVHGRHVRENGHCQDQDRGQDIQHHGSIMDSITDMLKSGAIIARNVLWHHIGLEAKHRIGKVSMTSTRSGRTTKKEIEKEANSMSSTPFLPLSTALLMKHDNVPRTRGDFEGEKGAVQQKKNQQGEARARIVIVRQETAGTPHISDQLSKRKVPTERVAVHRRGHQPAGLKALPRPDRWIQRIYSISPSKFIQDLSILVKDDSLTGKLAMVLMSTICGVGVGMFGALLFVVALKVRLFQTRRSGQHSHQQHPTAAQQLQMHQQLREYGCKKVIPRRILDSFGVQTVLHTTSTTMVTTAIVKADAASFTKVKLAYAEDVIEMEEGFEDLTERENARRQRLRTRASHLFPRSTGPESDVSQMNAASEATDAEWERLLDGEELEEATQRVQEEAADMSDENADLEMERITAAIMSTTRRGSYRRISRSRQGQGQLEQDVGSMPTSTTTSVSSSLSLSLSSSDEKPKMCSGVHAAPEEKDLPFANANAQTMCAVCLGEYEVGDQVRTLPCHHQYHLECIDPWLLTVASFCPICKRDLWPGSS